MTDAVLVLAWLVLAHLVADFVLQTESIVRAKNAGGVRALRGLVAHGLIVAACLVPIGLAFGGVGWFILLLVAIGHVLIDRTKIVLTRRAAVAALRAAHDLGRAWTSRPAALFLADQIAHLVLIGIAFGFIPPHASLEPAWVDTVNWVLGPSHDRAAVHQIVSVVVVLLTLLIANVRAASIFVAILVRPVEEGEGGIRWGGRVEAESAAMAPDAGHAAAPRRWSVRIGPLDARVQAELVAPVEELPPPPSSSVQAARVGSTIGILERILIVVFVLTGSEAAIGFVVAAKTLARFRLLDDRDFAEYYLLGTLASVAVAIITGLIARAALSALLA